MNTKPIPDWVNFGKAIMEHWPEYDVDGGDLQDLAEKYNMILPVEGGFNPEQHDDEEGGAEPGDLWFMLNY